MNKSRITLLLIPVLLFVLACQAVTRPIEQAQNAGSTAVAFATDAGEIVTQISGLATEAGDFATQVAPLSTAMAAPSAASDLPGNIFDPKSPPLAEWKGIPIMPQALAGEEEQGMYVFTVNAAIQDVQAYYADQLPALGWSEQFSMPESQGIAMLLYGKGDQVVSITITTLEGRLLVMLNLQ